MHIEELNSKTNSKFVTVTFSYDEIRDISNGLYYALKRSSESNDHNKESYEKIYAKIKFIYDMIKHGYVQDITVNRLMNSHIYHNILRELEEKRKSYMTEYGLIDIQIQENFNDFKKILQKEFNKSIE